MKTEIEKKYLNRIIPLLKDKFQYKNLHQVPKILKIEVSSSLGLNAQNKNYLQKSMEEFLILCKQKPTIAYAKKSIANFKIRKGIPLGIYLTLRRNKMYSFLENLIINALPQIKDFQGLNLNGFDSKGNYNFGINDQSIFAELESDELNAQKGFNIAIVTNAKTIKESYFLLEEIGVPFYHRKQTKTL